MIEINKDQELINEIRMLRMAIESLRIQLALAQPQKVQGERGHSTNIFIKDKYSTIKD